LDAIFEVRFEPSISAAGEVLPGLLYKDFKEEYDELEALPASQVPREIRESDSKFKYKAHYRLARGAKRIAVGSRVLNVYHGAPYPGWSGFRAQVQKALQSVKSTGLVKSVERYSFRYVNVIPGAPGEGLEKLNGVFTLRDEPIDDQGFNLRTEFDDGEYRSIVKIGGNVSAELPEGETRSGLLVDIDTLREVGTEVFWRDTDQLLDEAHDALKRNFFSLLKRSTIEGLGPKWGKK
jgi:uncharacterized protein (TIGR04255 family)